MKGGTKSCRISKKEGRKKSRSSLDVEDRGGEAIRDEGTRGGVNPKRDLVGTKGNARHTIDDRLSLSSVRTDGIVVTNGLSGSSLCVDEINLEGSVLGVEVVLPADFLGGIHQPGCTGGRDNSELAGTH